MKFARLLRATVRDLPEMQELLACYKDMKKLLKSMFVEDGQQETAARAATEAHFVSSLCRHLSGFNSQWVEREERFVIRLHTIQDQVAVASDAQSKLALHKQLLDFHGESLLMMHWSILAYTGLVKIMKKYKKRTGKLLDAPHLTDLLSQPFCSTEVMSSLVSSVEGCLKQLSIDLGMPVTQSDEDHSVRPVNRAPPSMTVALSHSRTAGCSSGPLSLDRSTVYASARETAAASDAAAAFCSIGSAGTVTGAAALQSAEVMGHSPPAVRSTPPAVCAAINSHVRVGAAHATVGPGPSDVPSTADLAPVAVNAVATASGAAAAVNAAAAGTTSGAAAHVSAPAGHAGETSDIGAAYPPDDDDDDDDDDSEEDDDFNQLMWATAGAPPGCDGGAAAAQSQVTGAEAMMKKTRLALSTWRHLQRASITPSTILPAAKRQRTSGPGHSSSSHA